MKFAKATLVAVAVFGQGLVAAPVADGEQADNNGPYYPPPGSLHHIGGPHGGPFKRLVYLPPSERGGGEPHGEKRGFVPIGHSNPLDPPYGVDRRRDVHDDNGAPIGHSNPLDPPYNVDRRQDGPPGNRPPPFHGDPPPWLIDHRRDVPTNDVDDADDRYYPTPGGPHRIGGVHAPL